MSAGEALRSAWITGLAMATMVPSRATIMTPTATVSRVSQGWPCMLFPRAGAAGGGASAFAFLTTDWLI